MFVIPVGRFNHGGIPVTGMTSWKRFIDFFVRFFSTEFIVFVVVVVGGGNDWVNFRFVLISEWRFCVDTGRKSSWSVFSIDLLSNWEKRPLVGSKFEPLFDMIWSF